MPKPTRNHRTPRVTTARLLATILAVPALMVTHATPAQACGTVLDVVYLYTFDVTISVDETDYEIGDTVTVDVTVMRPAKEDPLGLGTPTPAPQQAPAAGVRGAVSLKLPKGFVFGWGITDDTGTMTVDIDLDGRITPGPAKAAAYAWTSYPLACLRVDEVGYLEVADFLTVHASD